MVTPGVPPIPHVGGPVTGPGAPTVLIGGKPAAVMGDMCVCTGPPDTIILGSMGVLICGKPAARMGDMCAHGGTIVLGQPNVLIGEMSPGAPGTPAGMAAMANFMIEIHKLPGGKAGALAARQTVTLSEAAVTGAPFCEICEAARNNG
jgi:uncharacterized Zn-binding protein involved in type VI secretion